ncbi:hypothetical protein SynBIOSU31_01454 [Synechococcus sp. BIOS-U3-1]|nr:hypothetical protein SynBIOSU31_01454 [Synechococcus sp. BIOS-U3-1]
MNNLNSHRIRRGFWLFEGLVFSSHSQSVFDGLIFNLKPFLM